MGHLPEREVCYMRRHIDFDKIGITDDVMFCTVLSNSEDCREFLQRILGIEIEEIVVVGTQVSMKSNFTVVINTLYPLYKILSAAYPLSHNNFVPYNKINHYIHILSR